MTPEQRQAARARCEAATEGPWERRSAPHPDEDISKADYMASLLQYDLGSLMVVIHDYSGGYLVTAIAGDGPNSGANADFIAHAREDLPAALDEIDRLERLLLEHGIMSPKEATHAVQEQRRCEGSVEALEGEQPRKGTGEQAAVADQECGGNRGEATGQAGGDA